MDQQSGERLTATFAYDALNLKPGAVTTVFQPIFRVNGTRLMVAAEALARGPRGTPFEKPTMLFAAARRAGVSAELDRLCIATALRASAALPRHAALFLNVHPGTLCDDPSFPAFLAATAAQADVAPARITVELLEHARVAGRASPQLHASLDVLRGFGVGVAVDDVGGAGAEETHRALAFHPDYLKMDADLVRGSREDLGRRAVVQAIAELAAHLGIGVIAEGIEDAETLDLVRSFGIELVQGYLLGRPCAATALADAFQRDRSVLPFG